MRYVDWVDHVLTALDRVVTASGNTGLTGIGVHELLKDLGLPFEEETQAAIGAAVNDLELVGCANAEGYGVKVTAQGQRIARAGGLRRGWQSLFERYAPLDEDREVLAKIVQLGVVEGDEYASTELVEVKDALRVAGRDSDQAVAILTTKRLQEVGCLHSAALITMGGQAGRCQARPSYVGIVLVTEERTTDDRSLLDELIADWETTGVDIKEVVELNSDRQKAEFCKDILALANTLVSGRRILLIGYNNKSREFSSSVDPRVDAHRMESVLAAYCRPVPEIRYTVVPLERGNAGLIEVLSRRAHLPYKLDRDIWKFKADSVFVRHNTLVELAAEEEVAILITEGEHARRS